MHSLRRAGVALAALVTLGGSGSAQIITARVADSVFVAFFIQDQSPHVFRGGATFTVCGSKTLYARFYADAALTRLLKNHQDTVSVPCLVTDTTKTLPVFPDTTKWPPTFSAYPGFPPCAGIVSDSSVHLPYCSPPNAPPLFLRVYGGAPVISCKLNRWSGTGWIAVDSLCAAVASCETQNTTLGGSFDHPMPFACADTNGLFARTNLLSPTIPP